MVEVRRAGADAAALSATASAAPFNLTEGPLVRSTVYRIDDRTTLVLLAGHHLVVDGASLAVLMADLGLVYAALATGRHLTCRRELSETVDPGARRGRSRVLAAVSVGQHAAHVAGRPARARAPVVPHGLEVRSNSTIS